MSELGRISFRNKTATGHFAYAFKISDYHAAKILEYVAQISHEPSRVSVPKKQNLKSVEDK